MQRHSKVFETMAPDMKFRGLEKEVQNFSCHGECRDLHSSPARRPAVVGAAHCTEAREVQRHSKPFETMAPDMKFRGLEKEVKNFTF